MKDSQPTKMLAAASCKYIKANNERFSTIWAAACKLSVSISRRIMKDSQRSSCRMYTASKYIKANNERFSTLSAGSVDGS